LLSQAHGHVGRVGRDAGAPRWEGPGTRRDVARHHGGGGQPRRPRSRRSPLALLSWGAPSVPPPPPAPLPHPPTLSAQGRLACLTNVSVPDSEERPGARSRGDLTARFLLQEGPGAESPMQFLGGIDPSDYNSLNVFLGDLASGDLAYFTNRDGRAGASRVETVGRGVHTVSNDVLGEGWPKTRRLAAAMEALAARHGRRREVGVDVDALHEDVLAVMREDGGAAGPGAGRSRSGEAWGGEGGDVVSAGEVLAERIFIPELQFLEDKGESPMERRARVLTAGEQEGAARQGDTYGTRSQTVISVTSEGRVRVTERARLPDGRWHETREEFVLRGRQQGSEL